MNIKSLKAQAHEALGEASYNPKKLFFLYAAISLGLGILISLLDAVLADSIASTVGLAGMQTRAVLTTAQTVLQTISTVALPFLQFGIVYGSLLLIRRERADVGVLPQGFRRFGPVMRLLLMKILLLSAAVMACAYASSMLFMLTPLSNSFMELLAPVVESGDMAAIEAFLYEDAALQQLLPAMAGFFVFFVLLACGVCIPLGYRMSMADFVVMDAERKGGFAAIRQSFRLTKGRCLQLFRLDLSFWWYFALNVASGLLFSADGLLQMAGVTLPVSDRSAYWICYGVYMITQLALLTLAAPKVQTTYAAAYEMLRNEV